MTKGFNTHTSGPAAWILAIVSALLYGALILFFVWTCAAARHYRVIPQAIQDSISVFQQTQKMGANDAEVGSNQTQNEGGEN